MNSSANKSNIRDEHTPTRLIREYSNGNSLALNELFELIYDELQRIAQQQRNRWNGHETLDACALIHESYLKISRNQPVHIESRSHFMALAAKAMRQILINNAEKNSAQKRGGNIPPIKIEDIDPETGCRTIDSLIDMDKTLNRLQKINSRQSRVFECRFFGGMTVEDTAFALKISPATVKRDWQAACNWIYKELNN